MTMRAPLGLVLVLVMTTGVLACDEKTASRAGEAPRDPLTGLTEAEASEVLATVGERKITLGEYAATLARMDRFERLRYQSEERQKQLLDEMIEVELLAQEARRRGLDKKREVQLLILEGQRDELLESLRASLPKPEALSEREVREYYDAHRSEFHEPLRHRVQVIVVGSAETAGKVAEEAQGSSGEKWGELARKYSLDRRGLGPTDALELAGDLGFVSAPGQTRGDNAEVPAAVRAAVFTLAKVGEVAGPVPVDRRHYVVRLAGISPARDRTLRDADRSIRAELLRQKFLEAERALEAELRKKYPVTIDEARVRARAAELAPPNPSAPVGSAPARAAPAGSAEPKP